MVSGTEISTMKRKFQQHYLDFSQEFFPITKDGFMFNIHRFQVFNYLPTTLTPNNVRYFFIADHDYQEGEFAIMGVCDYNENCVRKRDCQMKIRNGDRELFSYIKILLLERLDKISTKEFVAYLNKGVVEKRKKE